MPAHSLQEFPYRFRGDAEPPRNLSVCHTLCFQSADQLLARTRQPGSSRREAARTAQGGEPSLGKSTLMPADRSRRATENPRNIILVCPSLLYEADHRVILGHSVTDCVLG
jgi:hypothetical protein